MKNMHLLLDNAEMEWRSEVKRDFPLRGSIPVNRETSDNERDWMFYTNMKTIYAKIYNDASLQEKFENVVARYWDGEPEDLAGDTLHYLLFHELYHPIEAPFSVSGENNDNTQIAQAIRRGLLTTEPDLSPLEQIVRVKESADAVKDFILDNRFYLDNKEKEYVREDIIPVWDFLELKDAPEDANFYTVTRFIYGALYGPQSTHGFFEDKTGKDGVDVAEKALSALIGKPVELPRQKESSVDYDKTPLSSKDPEGYDRLQEYAASIREVFSGDDRYGGIERFMAVLGPYIKHEMPQGCDNTHDENDAAGVPQNILQDFFDDMSPQEQQEFVNQLAQESDDALQQAASQMQGPHAGSSHHNNEQSEVDPMKNLDAFAMHEFYKRDHPKVKIFGGDKYGESVVVGKQEYWNLTKSHMLTEYQVGKLNLQKINNFEQKTGLPCLIELENGTYRLNEYELKQRNRKDIVYADALIDVPDVVEFYLDSSGSMFNHSPGDFKVNDGGRWDMVCHVLYGFADALREGGRKVGKKSNMRIHNFADERISSAVVPVDRFWEGDSSVLSVLFKPENGYGTDLEISNYNDGKKRTYVIVTDGEVKYDDREAKKMGEIARNPKNNVLFFEIGATYDLGREVIKDRNINYHQIHDKAKMMKAGIEVLLSK